MEKMNPLPRTQAEDFIFSWESLQQDRAILSEGHYGIIANYLWHLTKNFIERDGRDHPELSRYIEEYRDLTQTGGIILRTGLVHIDRICHFGPSPERIKSREIETIIDIPDDIDPETIAAEMEKQLRRLRFR